MKTSSNTIEGNLVCLNYVKLYFHSTFTVGTVDVNFPRDVTEPIQYNNPGLPFDGPIYMAPPNYNVPDNFKNLKSANSCDIELILETGFKCTDKSDDFLKGNEGDTRSTNSKPTATGGKALEYGNNIKGGKSVSKDLPLELGSVWYSEKICSVCCKSPKSEGVSFKISPAPAGRNARLSFNNGNEKFADGRPKSYKKDQMSLGIDEVLNLPDNKIYSELIGQNIINEIKSMIGHQLDNLNDQLYCGGPLATPIIYDTMIENMQQNVDKINEMLISQFLTCGNSTNSQSVCVPCGNLGIVTLDDIYLSQGLLNLISKYRTSNTITDSHKINTFNQAVLEKDKLDKWIKNK